MQPNIRELLYQTDPYLDYPVRESYLRGWNSRHPKLAELIHLIEPKLIVEVGSWLGASALFMTEHTQAHIVCLDTWLGAGEMWKDHSDPERYQSLRIEHGQPTVMRDFMSNVIRAGKQSQITPMPLPSGIGLRLLEHWNIHPDMIYIDGDHSFESVKSDIENSFPLCPRVICGDDWGLWEGVTKAVQRCLPDANKDGAFWWIDQNNRVSSPAIE